MKLILCGHWMHLSYMHPVTSENHFHCTRLYLGTSEDKTRKQLSSKNLLLKLKLEKCAWVVHVVLFLFDKVLSLTPNDQSSQQQISIFSKLKVQPSPLLSGHGLQLLANQSILFDHTRRWSFILFDALMHAQSRCFSCVHQLHVHMCIHIFYKDC